MVKRYHTSCVCNALWLCLIPALGGCEQRYTAEELASHEAWLKGSAECDRIQDAIERVTCYKDVPTDFTEVPPNELSGVPLTGIDHLADHLSVQDFYVDGTPGAQAGPGGSLVCCVDLPNRWRPDLTVDVRWNVSNWRDCTGDEFVRRVPVERYDRLGQMYVHFLSDGSVKVVSSNWGPGGALAPGSKYPIKVAIPDKHPWAKYPLEETCKWRKDAP